MKADINNLDNKNNPNDNDILNDLTKELQEIIDYTQDNLIKSKENGKNEINLDENEIENEEDELSYNKMKKEIKLGEKRKLSELSDENDINKNINKNSKGISNIKHKRENKNIEIIGYEIIKRIRDIIIKINNFNNNKIKEQNQKDKLLYELKINNIKDIEIEYNNGRYIGQVVNGLKEGKGIYYYNDGERYEGDWKNDKYEGKGIHYYNDGERYEGDFKNNSREGKGKIFYNNGERYEGDFKNDLKQGKGIYYWNDGDRDMGDYSNAQPIGKHARLTKSREVKTVNY